MVIDGGVGSRLQRTTAPAGNEAELLSKSSLSGLSAGLRDNGRAPVLTKYWLAAN